MIGPDALIRELSSAWSTLNDAVFGGAMRGAPTIAIDAKITHLLGEWNPVRHTIRLSENFVMEGSWHEVLEVLKHEMAHEYVSEVLGVSDETAHGPAFQMICKRYGIDHHAAHRIGAPAASIVEKARKLLALSQSPNRHEAEAALAALSKLRHKHRLSAAAIDETSAEDGFVARALGHPATAGEHHYAVATILGGYFHVRPIWIHIVDPRSGVGGGQLEVIGRPKDVDLAEYVHGWLHRTAEELCPKSLKKKERGDYLLGIIFGFKETLAAEGAIVKAEDDADLNEFFGRRHPRVRSAGNIMRPLSGAYFEGKAQGSTLKMSKPLDSRQPKLLK